MNNKITKSLLFLSIYFFTIYNNAENNTVHGEGCLCQESSIVRYALEVKNSIANKLNYIPNKTKEIVAEGIITVESACEITKDTLYNGINYVKEVINSVISWAHDIKKQ
jgi:hypothetical protein